MGYTPDLMQPGEVIANRFAIEREVAVGGMSRVYRARDEHTGMSVAIKVVNSDEAHTLARFAREAALLAEIHHPGIVRHVAHGGLPSGRAYLAMEWLDGVDLSQYLRKRAVPASPRPGGASASADRQSKTGFFPSDSDSVTDESSPAQTIVATETRPVSKPSEARPQRAFEPLSIEETLHLGQRAVSAVAELHRRGIIHRDIKPANLFLPGGEPGQVKLLDLGTVRQQDAMHQLTHPGHIVGTPRYMAPEQVRDKGRISPATDVWAIGCVLYQCLTGVRLFAGANLVAVLSSILLDTPLDVADLRADVPAGLAFLVMSTLHKDPAQRPADARALVEKLEQIERSLAVPGRAPRSGPEHGASPKGLTRQETRVICLLFCQLSRGHRPRSAIAEIAGSFGGEARYLANGAFLVTMPGNREPTEQAARAAHIALALCDAFSGLAMVLVTGRVEGAAPMGSLAGRAQRMHARAEPGLICLDERTASLLASRFYLSRDEGGVYLGRARVHEATPTLLGKPSSLVGRRRELTTLMATLKECIESRVARAVLVTGPGGMGKSRLCRELLHEMNRQGLGGSVEALYGRGDVVSAGSPFVLLGPAIRHAAGIVGYEGLETRQRKIRARLGRVMAASECERLAPFIGELIGVPFADEHNQALQAARRDPIFRGRLMQAAWEEWLHAECAHRPVLMVLEDLHWADAPSIQYIDAALSVLENQPFMVLALARPEVHQAFPQLWAKRARQELPVHGLSARDSALFLRNSLGDEISDELAGSVVEHAEGNAFFLEELIRAVARGQRQSLPSTVLGMVQARLDTMGAEAKRILRAASIFGEVFWKEGVVALLQEGDSFEADEWLRDLSARETVKPQPFARLGSQTEYRFRHSLVREGAYAMLTSDDRRLGHALAASWLEQAGEPDPGIIAEHFMAGGEPVRAIPYFHRAARAALHGNALGTALDIAQRAVDAGAEGNLLGELHTVQSTAAYWLARYPDSQRFARAARDNLTPGSRSWFTAMANDAFSGLRLGEHERANRLFEEIRSTEHEPGAYSEKLDSLCRAGYQLLSSGDVAAADAYLELAADALSPRGEAIDSRAIDTRTMAQIHSALALRSHMIGDWNKALHHTRLAVETFEAAGDVRNACHERVGEAIFWSHLGYPDRSVDIATAILENATKLRVATAITMVKCQIGYFLVSAGAPASRARMFLEEGIAESRAAGNLRMAAFAMTQLAVLEHEAGSHERARELAESAVAAAIDAPSFRANAMAVQARILKAIGRYPEAVAVARQANRLIYEIGVSMQHQHLPALVLAQALHAAGDRDGSKAAIVAAFERLRGSAEEIENPDWRASFLAIPDHRCILDLAREWAGLTLE